MLVEDDKIAQLLTKKIFSDEKYPLDIAGTGKDALEFLGKNRYNLVLMDIGLPDMQGTEVSMRFREKEDKKHHTPIIALSAQGLEQGKKSALDAGMDDYIEKPFSKEKLQFILKKLIT